MQSALKWLTPLVTLGVAVFIVVFLIKINPSQEMQTVNAIKLKSMKVQDEKSEQPLWVDHFSKSEQTGYFYPVNEIFVDLELSKNSAAEKNYELSATIANPYQFFCLQEVLKQKRVKYNLKKYHTDTKVLIYSQEKDKLDSLIKTLKTYDINAKILPYTEEK